MTPLDQSTPDKRTPSPPKTAKSFDRVSLEEAEAAVRTLLIWAGDDPNREGLVDTPSRVAKSYSEFFSGYETDPGALLSRTFEEVNGYDDIDFLNNIKN